MLLCIRVYFRACDLLECKLNETICVPINPCTQNTGFSG